MTHNENNCISVLVITSILPIDALPNKVDENDVILVTEQRLTRKYGDAKFSYFFSLPASNALLGLLSKQWKAYFRIGRMHQVPTKHGKHVFPLPIIRIPKAWPTMDYLAFLCSIPFFKKRVDGLLKRIKPRLIHAHNLGSNGLLARYIKRKYSIPYIVTARIDKVVTFSKMELNILKDANAIICLTPSQLNKLPAEFARKAVIIPHGVDTDFFMEPVKTEHEALQMITIARLLPYKNIEHVILALSTLNFKFQYHIYGRGPEHDNLASLIGSLGLEDRVFLHGHVDYAAVPRILADMDLFMLPSFPETFGRVYIEAMAASVPIVACKKSGMDGVIEAGKAGFLLENPDTESIRSLLEHVFENREQLANMRAYAHATAQQFHWDRIVSDLHSLYEKHSMSI